jgi:hypothetical protein
MRAPFHLKSLLRIVMSLGRFSVGVLVEDRYPSVVSCNENAGCVGTCILHELSAPQTYHHSDFTAIAIVPWLVAMKAQLP